VRIGPCDFAKFILLFVSVGVAALGPFEAVVVVGAFLDLVCGVTLLEA